jgi:hypothetical protein
LRLIKPSQLKFDVVTTAVFNNTDNIFRSPGETKMNQDYYNAVTKMEEAGVDPEYIIGWEGGYVLNPPREEQRVTDAYEAGYEDGKEKNADNFSKWAK